MLEGLKLEYLDVGEVTLRVRHGATADRPLAIAGVRFSRLRCRSAPGGRWELVDEMGEGNCASGFVPRWRLLASFGRAIYRGCRRGLTPPDGAPVGRSSFVRPCMHDRDSNVRDLRGRSDAAAR